MVNAIVLMNVVPDKIGQVAEQLLAIKGVSEVYSVAGRFDLVTFIRVKDNEAIADIVTREFRGIEGLKSTETLVAFRAYSAYDLERMFSIGMA